MILFGEHTTLPFQEHVYIHKSANFAIKEAVTENFATMG